MKTLDILSLVLIISWPCWIVICWTIVGTFHISISQATTLWSFEPSTTCALPNNMQQQWIRSIILNCTTPRIFDTDSYIFQPFTGFGLGFIVPVGLFFMLALICGSWNKCIKPKYDHQRQQQPILSIDNLPRFKLQELSNDILGSSMMWVGNPLIVGLILTYYDFSSLFTSPTNIGCLVHLDPSIPQGNIWPFLDTCISYSSEHYVTPMQINLEHSPAVSLFFYNQVTQNIWILNGIFWSLHVILLFFSLYYIDFQGWQKAKQIIMDEDKIVNLEKYISRIAHIELTNLVPTMDLNVVNMIIGFVYVPYSMT